MQTIQQVQMDEASEPTRQLLEAVYTEQGNLTNMLKTMAQSPRALQGYLQFARAIEASSLDPVLSEQIALTVAQADQCDYSIADHTRRAKDLGMAEDEILASRESRVANQKVEAALRFARGLARRDGHYAVADLRRAGYTDREIVNIIAWVGLSSFENLFNMVAKTDLDFPRPVRVA